MQRLDLKNKRFGRLLLLEYKESDHRGQALWHARCDCGASCVVVGRRVKDGSVVSCGCYHRERSAEILRGVVTKHGLFGTPEWLAWKNMHDRCLKSKHPSFARYGGRGITVDPRWSCPEQFVADMGLRPSPAHSVDRIDNDGPYSPENCRWATRGEQASNRRNNRLLVWEGKTKTLSALAAEHGISVQALNYRLRAGWPLKRALTDPIRRGPRGKPASKASR